MQALTSTQYAKASVLTDPYDGITLVNKATYFKVKTTQSGIAAGQIHTASVAGFPVQIQAAVADYNYVFGDGAESGWTSSPGGLHAENGDITHTYSRSGDLTARIDTRYTGRYRVGGGGWIDIPGTVVIPGAPITMQIKETRNRLVT